MLIKMHFLLFDTAHAVFYWVLEWNPFFVFSPKINPLLGDKKMKSLPCLFVLLTIIDC